MKQLITITILLVVSTNLSYSQVKIEDTLVLNIYSQSYLKLQDMVDCTMPMTTIEKRVCANLEFQRVHKILEDMVQGIVADFKKDDLLSIKDTFLTNQQEWIERRNKEVIYINGPFQNMNLISKAHLETLTELTLQRITLLEDIMAN